MKKMFEAIIYIFCLSFFFFFGIFKKMKMVFFFIIMSFLHDKILYYILRPYLWISHNSIENLYKYVCTGAHVHMRAQHVYTCKYS
jgi:hypothetical protein